MNQSDYGPRPNGEARELIAKPWYMKPTVWVIAGVALLLVIWFVGRSNTLNSEEKQIKYRHTDSQNVLSTVFNDAKSNGFVVKEYHEAFIEAIKVATSGKYGKGINALVLAMREHNIPLPDAMSRDLIQKMSANWQKFETAQTAKLDVMRSYETNLDGFFTSLIVKPLGGFPRINLEEYKIVVSDETAEAFETGRVKPVNPFEGTEKKK